MAAIQARIPEKAVGTDRYPRKTSVLAICWRISAICVNASRNSMSLSLATLDRVGTLHDKVPTSSGQEAVLVHLEESFNPSKQTFQKFMRRLQELELEQTKSSLMNSPKSRQAKSHKLLDHDQSHQAGQQSQRCVQQIVPNLA